MSQRQNSAKCERSKERGARPPAPPQDFGRARYARGRSLGAVGGKPPHTRGQPPQRYIEPRSGEGVWGVRLPTLLKKIT